MTSVLQDETRIRMSGILRGTKTDPTSETFLPNVFLMIDSLQTGGSERQFAALAQALDPSAFRVHLSCIQKRGSFLEGLGEVSQFSLGGSAYGWRSIRTRFRLARKLRSLHVDIAHAFDFYTNLTLIPAALLAHTPVIIGSQRQLGDLLSSAGSRAQLAMFRRCDAVVCNSQAAASRLIASGLSKRKIVVITNGLSPSCFMETDAVLPRQAGILRIGMIARMNTEAKNHRNFLRAAARIVSERKDVEFVLVGDGPLRAELEAEAGRLGLANHARFLGDQRNITGVLASLDVSVLPSASESLSNVIIESMAAGVPVVANRVGGNPELIAEDRGILVDAGGDQALADAIEILIREPGLRQRLGNNAKQFARQHFTIEQMQRRHAELYTMLLEKNKSKSKPRVHSLPVARDRPIQVSIVAASRYIGGHSVQADLLLRHWKTDPEVRANLISIDPLFPRWLKWAEKIPFLRTLIRQPLYLAALWRGLKNADIAHIFSASYWSFIVAPIPAWLVARSLGKKTLLHYHSGEARDHLQRFRTALPVLKRVDALVVPSDHLVDVFSEFGLHAKVVPNIVDTSQFSFRLRKPLQPHLLCTRGFHPYYCIDVVVRAFAEVRKVVPNAQLDLVGSGPSETAIRTLVEKLGIGGINFVGVASRDTIAKIYDQADIFINASRLDNMPVSILEAFSSGTLVVSTAPEGMKYLVEHECTGLLSEVGNSNALAENVIRLLQDSDLASRIALTARETVHRYSWEAVRLQWLELYKSLAAPGSGQNR